MIETGKLTFIAGAELERRRRVKFKAGATTTPPEVVYAGAGEMHIGVTENYAPSGQAVAVRLINHAGSHQIEAAGAINQGAVVYGAADGKIGPEAVGGAIGLAKGAAGAAGVIVEIVPWLVLSTAAATVSIADTAGHFAGATVEAALAQIGAHLRSAQTSLAAPLGAFTRADGTPLAKFADGASTIPGFSQAAGGSLYIRWNNHASPAAVGFCLALPPALDEAAALELHFMAALTGDADTPAMECKAYIDGGADVAGADPEIDSQTMAEYVMTIAAADVPAGARMLTVVMGPAAGQLDTDDLLLGPAWLEIKPILLDA